MAKADASRNCRLGSLAQGNSWRAFDFDFSLKTTIQFVWRGT
jgi:hypothetical protein